MTKRLSAIFTLILCLIFAVPCSGATAGRLVFPLFKAFDSSGALLSGGLLYTYVPGTTTAMTTYTDAAATTAHANPIVLDSLGEKEIFAAEPVKLVLKDADGVTIWTKDSVAPIEATTQGIWYIDNTLADSTTDCRETIQDAIDAASDAGGGIVVLPAAETAGAYYRITQPLRARDNVKLAGQGYGSFLKNDRTSVDYNTQQCVFIVGGYDSTDGAGGTSVNKETYYNLNAASQGDQTVTFTTTAQAANFAAGDCVILKSDTDDPLYATWGTSTYQDINEVVSVNTTTGVLTLKYPVYKACSDLQIAESGAAGMTDPNGYPVQIVRRFSVQNMRLEQGSVDVGYGVFGVGGSLECVYDRLWIKGTSAFSMNAQSRQKVTNCYVQTSYKLADVAGWSAFSYFGNIVWDHQPGTVFNDFTPLLHGEGAHHCTFENIWLNCGSSAGNYGMRVAYIYDSVFRNIHIIAPATTYAGLGIGTTSASATGPSGCTFDTIDVEVSSAADYGIYVGDANSGKRNRVCNSSISGAPSVSGVAFKNNTTGMVFENNYLPTLTVADNNGTNVARNNITKLYQAPVYDNAAVTHTGTTDETTKKTYAIALGTVGKDTQWRVRATGTATNAAGGDKIIYLKVGVNTILTHTFTGAADGTWAIDAVVGSADSLTAQSYYAHSIEGGAPPVFEASASGALAINTATTAMDITLTCDLGNAGDTITVRTWEVVPANDQESH